MDNKTQKKIEKLDKKINKKHSPVVYQIFENQILNRQDKLKQEKQKLEDEMKM